MSIKKTECPMPASFVIDVEVGINAPRERVWRALAEETDMWWLPDFYTMQGSKHVVLEARVGGQLREEGEGKAFLWFNVIGADQGRSVQMSGVIDEKYGGPVQSVLCWSLHDRNDGGTEVQIHDVIWGCPGPNLASSLEGGWKMLFTDGLKAWVEEGRGHSGPVA